MDLDQIAAKQHRMVSRRQAMAAGLSDSAISWRIDSGRWRRIFEGVYATHVGDVTWSARAQAGLLYAGDGSVLGRAAAGYLQGLREEPPERTVIYIPRRRRVVTPGWEILIQRAAQIRPAMANGLPVTAVEDTVLDRAVALAARAVQLRRTTAPELSAALRTRTRHPFARQLRLALGDIDDGAESVLEVRFVRDVERPHGLPRAQLQVPGTSHGRGVRRDFEYLPWKVVVEVDGELGHAGEGMRRDRRRDRATARTGRLTIRAGWVEVVYESCELAVDVGLTLASRGWNGRLAACSPTCPAGSRGRSSAP